MTGRVVMLPLLLLAVAACTASGSARRAGESVPADGAAPSTDAPAPDTPAARAASALEEVRRLAAAWEAAPAGERATIEAALVDALDGGVAFKDVEQLAREAKPGSLLDELVTYKLARLRMHLRDHQGAAKKVDEYLARFPQGRFAQGATAMRAQLQTRVAVDAKAIGVVLPLSGDYRPYGERALTAIKLGLGAKLAAPEPEEEPTPTLDPATGQPVEPPPEAKKKKKKDDKPKDETFTTPEGVKIIVKDSRGDPDRAAAAVRELVEKDHVVAIVGDILLDTAMPVALAAEEYAVPVVSLSRKDGVAEAGPWTFRLALTSKKQAAALAAFAMDELKLKRFGVMYPRHPYGLELMNAFWDEIDRRQGEVTAVESYAFDQTTFTTEAKALVGRSFPQSRAEYASCVAEASAIANEYQRKKAREKCTDEVAPIVDFDALLIPDGFRTVSYIVPALIAEDVLLTRHRRTIEAYRKTTGNNHVRPVQLLGPNMWNDPQLAQRLGQSIDGAVFVDGFDARDATKKVQAFVDPFAQVHKSRPALIEAQAYDAAQILGALLKGEGGGGKPTSREQLRDALSTVKEFPGVTGLIRFDEQGDSQTPLRFFEIEDGEIDAADADALAKGRQG